MPKKVAGSDAWGSVLGLKIGLIVGGSVSVVKAILGKFMD
jgi:hypothetical protein